MKIDIKKNYFFFLTIIVGTALCIIDCIVGSQPGRVQFVARNCIGILIAILIISNNGIKDYLKPCHAIWTAIYLIAVPFALKWGLNNYPYKGQFISALINAWIYGLIAINLFVKFAIKKNKLSINYILLSVWLLMMLLMVFSRNDSLWPLYFLIVFLSFYFTDFKKSEVEAICNGLPIGIIIGFFIIQGLALLFRPYDRFRYYGFYGNPNNNGLMYTLAYVASLCIILRFAQNNVKKVLLYMIVFLQTILISLSFYTGCRSALISDICLIIIFLAIILLKKAINQKMLINLCISFVICMITSIPISYLAIRYVPTIHLHPIYFDGEYSEAKILPGDPTDSEKYTSWQDVWEEIVSRYVAETDNKTENVNFSESGGIRLKVYKWYIHHLNVRGHRLDEETGVYISKTYTAPHAHNLFLQYAYWFGIPTAIVFIVLLVLCFVRFIGLIRDNQLSLACFMGLNILAFVVFGMFEVDWGVGNLSLSMLFIALLVVFKDLNLKNI